MTTTEPNATLDLISVEGIELRLTDALARLQSLRDRTPGEATETSAPPVPHRASSTVRGNAPEDWLPNSRQQGPIGEALLARGLVSAADLAVALHQQRSKRRRIGELLVEMGALSNIDLNVVLAEHLGIPFVDLDQFTPDPTLTEYVPEEFARRHNVLALRRWDKHILFAMADPTNVVALDDLTVLTRRQVITALADPEQLQAEIDRAYHRSEIESTVDDAAVDFGGDAAAGESEDEVGDEAPVVRLINMLLDQAVTDRVSDVHIEPTSEEVRVRYRIDGVLHDASSAPLSVLRPLVSRLKVMGGLDIAQHRVPQDGRFSVSVTGRPIDVRVATTPTTAGEAVVLRLLDAQRGVIDLDRVGLSAEDMARFVPAFQASQGSVFVTGPTGSGKTSTLYALISAIDTVTKSVVSVEDPVEYRVDGIKQIQINTRAGMTFPSALRSMLRADPDVIVIGEVRDSETARIAADASITGHLVLSTLHTTRAAATPMRLVDMGVEPYLVASSLSCVAAQRLARRLCDCARPMVDGAREALESLGVDEEMIAAATPRVPVGCPDCRRTGYHGRLALFEIMPVTEDISRLIVERAPSADIERVAVEQGMDTLRRAALKRVAAGELSIDEMLRVVS